MCKISQDSHYLICDFKTNQTQINNTTNYKILFGIDHPDNQFITLYQFQAIGGIQSQFILQDVPSTAINDHSKAVMEYEKIMNMKDEHNFSIRHLKRDMNDYKDSIINSITEIENTKKLKRGYPGS